MGGSKSDKGVIRSGATVVTDTSSDAHVSNNALEEGIRRTIAKETLNLTVAVAEGALMRDQGQRSWHSYRLSY